MKRKIVRSEKEFIDWINLFNGKMNCYTTVYDFEHYAEMAKVESSCIKDRMFLDFDAHGEPLENAWVDFQKIVKFLFNDNTQYRMYFSGKGFHIIVFGEKANDIRSIQSSFTKLAVDCPTLDRTGIQTNRLRRIPNTVNLNSNGPYYCTPLTLDDVSFGLEHILRKALSGNWPIKTYGSSKKKWDVVKPIEMSDIEVVAPKPPGELPILPCLYNSIMVENPGHYARVYLAQWYRDILAIGERNITEDKKHEIAAIILDEFKAIASRENIWLDWDESITKKNIWFIVNGGYHAPGCKTTLIPQGYCIGKCWRYNE
jgi:hypothetical protein